ncbi:MalY/PatB family protein [Fusobacterium sp. PH5-44]|uniref:MalY/PatB family protein n=1 Tax=unclassified Fusobacterium TaxID=2648384 RepID=UPI003D1D2CCA
MKYDFETLIPRKGTGSSKWNQMYDWNPDTSDDVVPLSVADMEFRTPPEIVEGLKKYLDNGILGYTKATRPYYEAVISWFARRHNFRIEKEWILNTPGVINAIYAGIKTFTNEGDGVIIFRPVYYPFSNSIEATHRKIVNCPLLEDDGYYTIDYDKFAELAKESKNKLLIFSNPHNPVGRVWKKTEIEKIAKIAIENNLTIISDEIWADFIMPGHEFYTMGHVEELLNNNLIICTAPSKTFNLAGLATSNIIIKNKELRDRYNEVLLMMRSAVVNILGLKACEIGYTESEEWFDQLLSLINKNQILVKNFFDEKFPKIKTRLIEGTYLQWIDFNCLEMTNDELERFMHMDAQFFTDEGYVFGQEGSGYERINLAVPTWVLARELERLEKALVKIYK